MTNPKQTRVEQAARDAAADYFATIGRNGWARRARAGQLDNDPLVQAMQSLLDAEREACAELVETCSRGVRGQRIAQAIRSRGEG